MRKTNWLVTAILIALLIAWKYMNAEDTIEYQGQTIQLSKGYTDYDAYKNDPNNLPPSEQARVQKLMMAAKIERTFPSRMDMIQAIGEIIFPGYGSTSFGEKTQSDGTILAAHSVEIPGLGKDRYFVFECKNGIYTLIDDFIRPERGLIADYRKLDGQLVFYGMNGKEVFRRELK